MAERTGSMEVWEVEEGLGLPFIFRIEPYLPGTISIIFNLNNFPYLVTTSYFVPYFKCQKITLLKPTERFQRQEYPRDKILLSLILYLLEDIPGSW